ncbi:tetratricopeptide repeat protein [Leptobacterium flavescens]|uniref:Tetratricopeptide repeat protein n=1 Tax=Leptobacterium flavescens TaxID=472055 RepID=A0A6P0UQ76_9FLAO|nr:AraC family transcriptional regulator [Leptobacterium flavescens]NER15285.1 tetratricopeptide repeat protein [Leptobacterium flavescens]
MLLTLFLVLFFSPLSGFSQEDPKKSYEVMKEEWEDKTYDELNSFFQKSFNSRDTIGMGVAADLILALGEKENKPEYTTKAYMFYGILSWETDKHEDAIDKLNMAVANLKYSENYRNKAGIYFFKGNYNRILAKYENALEDYLEGLNLTIIEGEPYAKNLAFSFKVNIALVRSLVYDTKESLEMYFDILRELEAKENENIRNYYLMDIYIGIAKAYSDLENYEEGVIYCHKTLEFCKKQNIIGGQILSLNGLANIYSLTGEYDKALQYLKEADNIQLPTGRDYFTSGTHLYRARTYYYLSRYEDAISELRKLEELNLVDNYGYFFLQETFVIYARSYQGLGDKENAMIYLNQGLEILEKNDERKNKISNIVFQRYNMSSIQDEIDQLTNDSKKQQGKLYFLLVVLGVLFVAFFVFYRQYQRKNKKRFKALIDQLNQDRVNTETIPEAPDQEKSLKIENDKVRELLIKLEKFEKEKKYLDRNSTLTEVAKDLKTNTTYLSGIINQYKNKSFSKYLTELRLDHAIDRIQKDPGFRAYTIKAIAQEVGFNNVNPFVKAFKEKTGIYPSYFIRELNKKES